MIAINIETEIFASSLSLNLSHLVNAKLNNIIPRLKFANERFARTRAITRTHRIFSA